MPGGRGWLAVAGTVLACLAVIGWLSPAFGEGAVPGGATLSVIGLLMLAGLAYWLAVWRGRSQQGLPALSVVFAVGLLMRLLMWPTTPILEVDFNRYLWDGAVSAHGLHPYRYAPEQIGRHPEQVPPAYRQLAREGAPVLARINHAYLTSIYPPVTQLFFALAHRLAPWKLAGWRAVLLAMDLLSFVLLVALLRQLNRPPAWSLIYWWNPLLIKELFNSAHMEGLLFPFLLAALLALLRRRENLAVLLLALATGIKLWPALLLPLFLRAWQGRWGRRALQAAGFAALSLLLLWPLLGTPEQASGLANYTTRWELNDALFPWFVKSWAALLPHWGIHPGWAQQWARVTVGLLVGLTALLVAVPPIHRPGQLVRRALVVVAVLFFLSPTQFPWYALWLLPLLVLEPVPALLLLTVTLPLYYGRYWLAARGLEGWFDAWGVWLEFGPVLLWLGYEWLSGRLGWLKRRGPAVPGLEVPDAQ